MKIHKGIYYWHACCNSWTNTGGGPRVVVSAAAFHARDRGSVPGLGGLQETKMFLTHPRVKLSIVRSLRDQEIACSASDRQGSNFESCVWRTVSSHSSHHPREVLLAQFSLYVHKGGLKPDSFHFLNEHKTRLCPNVRLMKAHFLRRRPIINPTLVINSSYLPANMSTIYHWEYGSICLCWYPRRPQLK